MLSSVIEDVKHEFRNGNMVSKIIIVNIAVFVLVNLIGIFIFLIGGGETGFKSSTTYLEFIQFFSISSSWWRNLTHPWSFFTSQFLHEDFTHLLWNMIFLYWFGRIVGDFIGNQRVLPLYLMGGLVGILLYILVDMLGFQGIAGYMIGASAGVMAIAVASAVIAPDYNIRLLLIGDIKLKYVVITLLFLDLIAIASFTNSGGHIAHLGGAIFGWFYVFQLRNGHDMAVPINQLFLSINSLYQQAIGRKKPTMTYKKYKRDSEYEKTVDQNNNARTTQNQKNDQQRIDAILEKIKQNGYENLSNEDKEFLFKASRK
ncbi:MAG: rhomboid family intramembrane serine protease [Saprospiraceae bacterium]|nr:rhomboid family intramembrane serine protease [Saprospiraceae bacterium]